MDKTIASREWVELVGLLREAREAAGLRQVDLARLLERPQSLVSDVESGQRRLDVVELRVWCRHLGVPLDGFIRRWQSRLGDSPEA